MKVIRPHVVYLPDRRDVEISPYGGGNNKLGPSVFTYSRPAGRLGGTCPGSTEECEAICYAKRIGGVIEQVWAGNVADQVPPIPPECKLLRIHVGGDFDTVAYIHAWVVRLGERPDVRAWAYTRSWRVPELLPALELLRSAPNLQLFASMDPSTKDMPPAGWRRAWIQRDWDAAIKGLWPLEERLVAWVHNNWTDSNVDPIARDLDLVIEDGTPSYVCPEETGRKPSCEACRYCFDGKRNDVTFLEH